MPNYGSVFESMIASRLVGVNRVVVDTETTGLGEGARIVEIGCVCADTGTEIFKELINPEMEIEPEATAVSGINNEMVKDCPTWPDIRGIVNKILSGRLFVAFNVDFDYRLIMQTELAYLPHIEEVEHVDQCVLNRIIGTLCVEKTYTIKFNMPHPTRYGELKRQSLFSAVTTQGIDVSDCQAHRAIDDCVMTQRLLKKMEQNDILTYQDIMR